MPAYTSIGKPFSLTLPESKATIHLMNTIEKSLNKIAQNILHIDEASLATLWDKYKSQMEHFSFSPEWEKSVIIFSIINAVRLKNSVINEQILQTQAAANTALPKRPPGKPKLKLVK